MGLKEGDVVRLKSGRPSMTVEQVSAQQTLLDKTVAFRVWFEVVAKQRVVERDTFLLSVLEAVNYDIEPALLKSGHL